MGVKLPVAAETAAVAAELVGEVAGVLVAVDLGGNRHLEKIVKY